MGALPMFASPIAMRPHFTQDWMEAALKENWAAQEDYLDCTGEELDEIAVFASAEESRSAVELLNEISSNAHRQKKPVFVPLMDGQVMEVRMHGYTEQFAIA